MKKLCIVGGGVTKGRAPYKKDVEIWSTVSVGQELPRVDVMFEMHDGVYEDAMLTEFDKPIYMMEARKGIPKSIAFPIDAMIKKYGKRFNGTVVMMLGFAAMQGYTDIELYGIDFTSDEEFGRKAIFMFMWGYLIAQGVNIKSCDGGYLSDTCKTYMYEDNGLAFVDDMKQNAKDQLVQDDKNIRALEERRAYMRGVRDTTERFERRFL